MNRYLMTLLVASAFACAPFGAAQADPQAGESNAWTEGGLQKVAVKGLDVVYARPGVFRTWSMKYITRKSSVIMIARQIARARSDPGY